MPGALNFQIFRGEAPSETFPTAVLEASLECPLGALLIRKHPNRAVLWERGAHLLSLGCCPFVRLIPQLPSTSLKQAFEILDTLQYFVFLLKFFFFLLKFELISVACHEGPLLMLTATLSNNL